MNALKVLICAFIVAYDLAVICHATREQTVLAILAAGFLVAGIVALMEWNEEIRRR